MQVTTRTELAIQHVSQNGRRTRIAGDVTEESRRGWETFLGQHNITVAGFLEAIGLHLGERASGEKPTSDPLLEVVERARNIDRERRKRRDT